MHRVMHKSFIDSFLDRLPEAVNEKIVNLSEDQMRSLKISYIEDIMKKLWDTIMARKYLHWELQIKKNNMNVQTGIGFMKKSFLTIKIEGAKLIDAACKQALTNFSFTNSPNHEKY
jgi:hypothetical protein